jgi:hypothetical protein
MYSQSEVKQSNVVAGISGSLLCEIACGDITNFKQWRKEWKDTDFLKGYDIVMHSAWDDTLEAAKDLEVVTNKLKEINLEANYHCIRKELEPLGVSTCGYTSQGRLLTVYNSVAQLTIDCSKPTGHQMEAWISKWC